MTEVNTMNDWMFTLAEAINNQDMESIVKLNDITTGWLQTSDERGAQLAVLEAVSEMMYEVL